ncbi:AT-rich interactive domain-containing protein 1A-like isoform X2 [Cucurbita pepo subsp. pepo]|uniref:AT-rich interactive domain-containing protein 1A-like isoform X2 n=1 Tax=Cucurbita pepo subsp. pepo TaxID=3664 RepID=UPI000C9D4B82|nr:AT-rich interactive domain-containing protein 1A-like isoform X2 [Cucurbita pepo subsp. pepo]
MGFDNECILNIQSLAGEYFCPVCRLLVYPHEALQSQCTHLYCKPCLTYVVSTTRACPYDGYLVTEADSKPLIESNKTLADTIGKIAVHCLYHRSGCTWQGPLSDCVTHCSGCAFGNSPVLCNRCGIQLVHRQVQEHAQTCPGVQSQAQQADGAQGTTTSGTAAATDQAQSAGMAKSQTQSSQNVAASAPAQDTNQQANASSQGPAVAEAAVPTSEQWYQQQQQQYQQYYQQYPGYDSYQQQYQHYYPYQQQGGVPYQQPQPSQALPSHVATQHPSQAYIQPQTQPQPQPQSQTQVPAHPQPQSQSQPQPQPQPQSLSQPQPPTQPHGQSQVHMHVQTPVVGQSQNQGQVNPQQQIYHAAATAHSQIQPQGHPPAHGQAQPQPQPQPQPQSYPQVQPNSQQPVHMPQYQQPHSQIPHSQAQIQQQVHPPFHPPHHSVSQPQSQLQAPAQHHSQLPNPQINQSLSMTPNAQPQMQNQPTYAATGYPSYPQPQHHQQMQLGVPQNVLPAHAQGGAHQQSQSLVQMQSQLPQPPPMRPPQPPLYQNQQQPPMLPSSNQVQNVSAAQQLHIHSHAQQPGGPGQPASQRPVMPLVQQSASQQVVHQHQHFGQQGQFIQNQLHMTPQMRPPGPPNSLSQPNHGYAHLQHNINLPHGMQHNPSLNTEGRSLVPNQGVQSIPYSQSMVGVPMRPLQPGANQPTMKQGHVFGNNGNQVQLPDGFAERKLEKGPDGRDSGSSSQKDAKRAGNHLDVASNLGADVGGLKTEKSLASLKVPDDKGRYAIGDKSIQADASTESTPQNGVTDSNLHVGDSGKAKQVEVKVEATESTFDHSSNDKLGEVGIQDQKDLSTEPKKMEDHVIENKGNQEGFLQKVPSQDTELRSKRIPTDTSGTLHPSSGADEGQQGATTTSSLILGSPDMLNQHGYQDKNPPQTGGTQIGAAQTSHPASLVAHTRHQTPPSSYVSSSLQQGALAPLLQAPPPGPYHQAQVSNNPSMQVRPRAPGLGAHPGQPFNPSEPFPPGGIPESGSAPSFGRGPGHYGPQQALERSVGSQATYSLSQPSASQGGSKMSLGDPVGAHFRSKLPGAFDTRGQLHSQRPIHPSEAEIFSNQRPRPDSHLPGTMEHRPPHLTGIPPSVLSLNGAPGLDSSSKLGLRDERFKLMHEEQLNPFPQDTARRPINQTDAEDVLRQFPRPSHLETDLAQRIGNYSLRPFDRGVHGHNYDTGLTIDGAAASRILPPRHMGGALHPTDAERPIGFYEDSIGPADRSRGHSDFPVPGSYGRRFVDGFGPRSPLHEYHGRGFGGHPGFPGVEEIDGQEFPRHFGDPLSFRESRFPIFRSHLQRGDFEGPGNFRISEHMRTGDLIGQDRHFGPRSMPGHLRLGEPSAFGSHPGHSRIGDLSVLGNFEPFGGGHRTNHPRLGEPGFRSSFSRQGLAEDGRFFAGDVESFDNSRKRKPTSTGWCRICKVDCETVEGLELHSQTREHQKMAMDMVQSIKQNAKKHKITPNDHSSEDGKSKNVGHESRGKKH